MSRNDAADMAARLYARVPGHYRVYDAEQGYPLLALLTVVGREAAALRTDLDDLWDDFFIETCDERIVPYLGALVGTKLLERPIGQSSRLDVWNTVAWRRSKGTPQMLGELAGAISGWPAQTDELFARLAWSQHLRHLRPERSLTVSLRDDARLGLLGGARDPFAHALDLRPAAPLDAARVTPAARGVPVGAFGTRGRYALDRLGVFVNRLAVYPIRGATPAPELVPAKPPAPAAPPRCFTFDPLFRDRPLFAAATGAPISRRAFGAAPWSFAADLRVRAWGVPLTADVPPAPLELTDPGGAPFDFGGRAAPFGLDPAQGLHVVDGAAFAGAPPFVVRATWVDPAGSTELATLGSLRTPGAEYDGGTFAAGAPAPAAGRLRVDVARAAGAGSARFPGAVLAVRAARAGIGALREGDALYVALPAAPLAPGRVQTWWVDAAGATYTDPSLHPDALARAGIGPVYPPRATTASAVPAALDLSRTLPVRLADPARLGGVIAHFDASVEGGAVVVRAQGTGELPPAELILTDRAGAALLVYLPAVSAADAAGGKRFLVADDGATYDVPAAADLGSLATTFGARTPARRSAGQTLPLAGAWPLRQRAAVAIDHRRREPRLGELGIDPENGRFRLAYGDPLVGSDAILSADYGEALRDAVGALGTADAAATPPTRIVAAGGDAPAAPGVPVYRSLHEALAALAAAPQAHETIELADSATYAEPPLELSAPALRSVTVRAAAGARPALVWSDPGGTGLRVGTPLERFALVGVLARGGSLVLDAPVREVALLDAALDPEAGRPALIARDELPASNGRVLVARSVAGPLALGAGVAELTVADSILGPPGAPSIGGLAPALRPLPPASPSSPVGSPPSSPVGSPPAAPGRAQTVRLERTTVFGTVRATVLHATDVVFADLVDCADRTTGCVRYTRYAEGSLLPPRFRTTAAPVAFGSRRFGRVDYALLDAGTAAAVRAASSEGAEPGAFARARDATRVANLTTKLREFAPVRMVPVAIAQT